MITAHRGGIGFKTGALEHETLGNSSATFKHDAWGNLLPGSYGSTPFKWNAAAGYQHVPFTGLYHVGAREYDPRTARWLQRDPIGPSSGDPNVYRYCGNDAVNLADPDGLVVSDVGGLIGKVRNKLMRLKATIKVARRPLRTNKLSKVILPMTFYHYFIIGMEYDGNKAMEIIYEFGNEGPGSSLNEIPSYSYDVYLISTNKWVELLVAARASMLETSKAYDTLNYNCRHFVFDSLKPVWDNKGLHTVREYQVWAGSKLSDLHPESSGGRYFPTPNKREP